MATKMSNRLEETYGSLESTSDEVKDSPLYGSRTELSPLTSINMTHNESTKAELKDTLFMSKIAICSILSTSFMYGCIMTTLFLLILPIECQRIEDQSKSSYGHVLSKNMCLGGFAAIAGVAQLITPLVGLISDNYTPPPTSHLGKRLPYLLFGTAIVMVSILGQLYTSSPVHTVIDMATNETERSGKWSLYTVFFIFHMIGLNVVYTVMIAFIPDLVPQAQTGIANGSLALMVTAGSLFGFGMYHFCLGQKVSSMYELYFWVAFGTTALTFFFARDREKELSDGRHHATLESPNTITAGDKKEIVNTIWTFPKSLVRNMLYDPLSGKSREDISSVYWIDMEGDFFWVTISRFFYYLGISSQTFFLYFIHDELRGTYNPEAAVSLLAIIGQFAGGISCYPVGIISDVYCGSRRRPFVYLSCLFLAFGNIYLLWCTTLSQMVKDIILLGAANGMYLTMDTSLACDTLDIEKEEDSGQNKSNADKGAAELLGIWGVFGFFGSALGPVVGGLILMCINEAKETNEDSDSSMKYNSYVGYVIVFSLSAFYFLCSAMSLTRIKKHHV